MDSNGYPCVLVYPHGTWTFPRKDNYDDLFSTTGSANINKTRARENIDPTNDINTLGLEVLSTTLKNVRCVRAKESK